MQQLHVLVCGGRDYDDWHKVDRVLSSIHRRERINLIIHGAQRGADTLASEWAQKHGIRERAFPVTQADWDRYGRAAGPMRNAKMLAEARPNLCISFPGGSGTADMTARAKLAGVRTLEING